MSCLLLSEETYRNFVFEKEKRKGEKRKKEAPKTS
jgi:hypothetical protein